MSSPSSAGSAKRKREPLLSANMKKSSTTDLLQPSSRDASGEDADDSAIPTPPATGKFKKGALAPPAPAESSSNPPKRPRTRSNTATESAPANGVVVPSIQRQDPGEPSDTTEASTDIASRSKLKKTASRGAEEEQGSGMKPPPTGLQDPKGYHTNPPPKGRPVRVYADGVFDLFHLGHMRQLEQAKKAFPDTYLLVGVTGDAETHKRKGLTVLSGDERAETVRHCKWVDEVLPKCPWIVTPEFIERHNIDYIAHDDEPYGAAEGDDIYKPIKERGQFLVTQRTEGVSTTGIITKIVRDYEKYIARQLKRGTSRQELNVSWLKKNELDLKRHALELRDSVVANWATTGQELGRDFRSFWERSRPASPARASAAGLSPSTAVAEGGESSMASPGPRSPAALAHLTHLDIPKNGMPSKDFAAGYSLGLIGGVRSWMTRSRWSLHGSQPGSPGTSDADESDSEKNVQEDKPKVRGRKDHRSEGDAVET